MKDCEIANILYNLSTDMDADDYADIYDIEAVSYTHLTLPTKLEV